MDQTVTGQERYNRGRALELFLNDPNVLNALKECKDDIANQILGTPDQQKRDELYFEALGLARIVGKLHEYVAEKRKVDKDNAAREQS